MRCTAGTGVLLSGGEEARVAYDLVECPANSRYAAEGQVFGDAEAIRHAFQGGLCDLRLESGRTVQVVLQDCDLHGAATAKVRVPMAWN